MNISMLLGETYNVDLVIKRLKSGRKLYAYKHGISTAISAFVNGNAYNFSDDVINLFEKNLAGLVMYEYLRSLAYYEHLATGFDYSPPYMFPHGNLEDAMTRFNKEASRSLRIKEFNEDPNLDKLLTETVMLNKFLDAKITESSVQVLHNDLLKWLEEKRYLKVIFNLFFCSPLILKHRLYRKNLNLPVEVA